MLFPFFGIYIYIYKLTNINAHIHRHTHTHIYIYIYIYAHICICTQPFTAHVLIEADFELMLLGDKYNFDV